MLFYYHYNVVSIKGQAYMSSDDSPRFMKSTGRSVTASRGGNISRRTLRLSRVRSETPCSSLRRCADKKAALLVRRAA